MPEEGIRDPETGLQMVESHCVGTGNGIEVLWKSGQCFKPLSHLSSISEGYYNYKFMVFLVINTCQGREKQLYFLIDDS